MLLESCRTGCPFFRTETVLDENDLPKKLTVKCTIERGEPSFIAVFRARSEIDRIKRARYEGRKIPIPAGCIAPQEH